MSNSTEVFALRRAEKFDEAFELASQIIEEANDGWNAKAFVYCLNDQIKKAVSVKDYAFASLLAEKFNLIKIDTTDDILVKTVNSAKTLADEEKKIIKDAKEQSKLGNHQEALTLFREAIKKFPNDIDLSEQFAWELHKEGKLIFDAPNLETIKVRTLLSEYMALKNERPSRLHSMFLRFADKIMESEDFNFVVFLRMWNLENLRDEDFEPFIKEDGTKFSSLAEKVIQHNAKLILNKKLVNEVEPFLPYLNIGINKFKDNIWLTYYNAKLLHLIGRNEEAIEFLKPVVKEKITEWWSWNYLAELIEDTDNELNKSCLCKALMCKTEEKFLINVRLKMIKILINNELWNEAKTEINIITESKKLEDKPIPNDILTYQNTEWYQKSEIRKSNFDYYQQNKQLAEEFIFSSLPWTDACLGQSFTLPDKPNKPRRKIFIQGSNSIIEISVSDKKFNTIKYKEGSPIKIKGEYIERAFQPYLLERRTGNEFWDIFAEKVGVIDHINHEKGFIHILINQRIDCIIKFEDIKGKFYIGSNVAVRLKETKKGIETFYKVLTSKLTDKETDNAIQKNFKGTIRISGAIGFTDDIFIENRLISEHQINENEIICGVAILNYNKKKSTWGWKAISIVKELLD